MNNAHRPSIHAHLAAGGTASNWLVALQACVAEHGTALDVSDLSRPQIQLVRGWQAALARAARGEVSVAAPAPVPAVRRVARRRASTSMRCSCAECRRGSESTCLRD